MQTLWEGKRVGLGSSTAKSMTPGLCTGRDHTGSAVVPAGDADTVHRSSVTALRKSDILLPFSPKIPAGVLLFTLLLSKFKFRTRHETSTIDVAGLPLHLHGKPGQ